MAPAPIRRTRMGKVSVSVRTPAGAPPHTQSFCLKRVQSSAGNVSSFDARTEKERSLLNSMQQGVDLDVDVEKKLKILEEENEIPLTDAEKDACSGVAGLYSKRWTASSTNNESTNQISYENQTFCLTESAKR